MIAFVGNPQATLEEAAIAAETTAQDRNHWTYYLHESRGLFNDWPCIPAMLRAPCADRGLLRQPNGAQAAAFVGEVVEHSRGRGYLAR